MPRITEKHNILPVQEINTKETERQIVVTQCKEYIEKVVAQYFPMGLTPQLLHLVEEYASGIIRCTPIKIGINDTKGLRPIDFYHLIWNLWTRLDALDRRASCRFIKNAFPMILENTNEETTMPCRTSSIILASSIKRQVRTSASASTMPKTLPTSAKRIPKIGGHSWTKTSWQ